MRKGEKGKKEGKEGYYINKSATLTHEQVVSLAWGWVLEGTGGREEKRGGWGLAFLLSLFVSIACGLRGNGGKKGANFGTLHHLPSIPEHLLIQNEKGGEEGKRGTLLVFFSRCLTRKTTRSRGERRREKKRCRYTRLSSYRNTRKRESLESRNRRREKNERKGKKRKKKGGRKKKKENQLYCRL